MKRADEAHPKLGEVREAAAPRTAPAEVLAVDETTARVTFADGQAAIARAAILGYAPRAGDRVLVTIDDAGDGWIVGVIEAARTPLLDAALEGGGVRRVRDPEGQLVFEYDPVARRAVLHVPDGDLEVSVPGGKLEMSARDGVRVQTARDVEVTAGRSLELRAEAAGAPGEEPRSSSLKLQPSGAMLAAKVLSAAADRAELVSRALSLHATRVESRVERARHVVGVLETRAGRIVERARDTYREVERLSQTRAGRLKLVAKKTAQLLADQTLVKARERVKIKGESIHLS